MEAAPLTQAHHASLHAIDPASHKQAADGFHMAADGVEDIEALRILHLLENQHRQIAQIVSGTIDIANPSATPEPSKTSTLARRLDANLTSTSQRSSSPVIARLPSRDLSSSIASNLATARGIPQNRRAGASQGSMLERQAEKAARDETQSTNSSTRAAPIKESSPAAKLSAETVPSISKQTSRASNEDAFERFYGSFGGLLSKLSAPLAFAGLPLTPEEPAPVPQTKFSRISTRAVTSSIPDIGKLISKAALRAVKEDDPGFGGVQDSFFVVPSSGGTVPYANIHRMREDRDEEMKHEEFVDAREAPQSKSPKSSRGLSSQPGKTGKSIEELEIENESLRNLTDDLSRRLYVFEKNSQNQGRALQQSIRMLPPPSRLSSDTGQGQSNDEEIAQLKEQLKVTTRENERLLRENEKLQTVVSRYRERWNLLKTGARARREGGETVTEAG